MKARLAGTLRAVRLVARDERIPRWLHAFLALGLLPAPGPGPFDEAGLFVASVVLLVFYRGPLTEAWRASVPPPPDRA